MARHLPDLEAFFHYRNLDVSSLKILASRWRPDLPGLKKRNVHLALDDIRESIEELRYYRDNFLQVPSLLISLTAMLCQGPGDVFPN